MKNDLKCSVAVNRLRALLVEVATTTVVSTLCFGVVEIRNSKICDKTLPYEQLFFKLLLSYSLLENILG